MVRVENAVSGGQQGGSSVAQPSLIPREVLQTIQALYDDGLCLQAYHAAQAYGPLKTWVGQEARILAGRLAHNLRASRLGSALHWLAWRSDKGNPEFVAYHGQTRMRRRGPLSAMEFLDRFGEPRADSAPEARTHLLTLRAAIAAHLRDFRASWDWLGRAEESSPGHPWTAVTRATVLEAEDRYAEALEVAREALKVRPWYRPGVQAVAHALQLLDRDEEALALLSQAVRHTENMHAVGQLALLQMDLQLYAEAAESLARFDELAPLSEAGEGEWLLRQRIALDCLRGQRQSALEGVRKIDQPYYHELALRLESGVSYKRVQLEVPFVRQHHLTCVPATLSAISRYWGQPAEHLEVAEAICYDGTPAHSERHWAETNGWLAREFRVTWTAAVALLDRGIPFTLTTQSPTSGHLQAVVGYDELRETLRIRDPFWYAAQEFPVKALLEDQQSSGPRGMALVPTNQGDLLESLELPEADLYDELHAVQRGLVEHQREHALGILERMQATAAAHRLTLSAQRALAAYDSNTPALLSCLEQLLQKYPDDGNLTLARLGCLRELVRRDERLRLLEGLCGQPGVDPIFLQQYAQELRADARHHSAAAGWVRWALRYRPTDPALVSAWADLLWDRGDYEQALRYYRLAAGLGETQEHFAQSYFVASRHLHQTEAAIAFLRDREKRLGRKSPNPTITLAESLQHLRRSSEAFEILNAALERRPEDGALQLFAADTYGRVSQFARAEKLLERARGHCPPAPWHRAAASLAGYQNQKQKALEHWREVLKIEPLSHDAIRASTLLLAETEGRQSAYRFLDAMCERFPFSGPLQALRIEWLGEEGAAAVIPHLRKLLDANPADSWAWRELAVRLCDGGELDRAMEAAQEAVRLDPSASAGFSVRAHVYSLQGRPVEARADLGRAVRLDVDNQFALMRFVQSGSSLAERMEALTLVASELRRQVIFSGALEAYQAAARGMLPPPEVLALLREAHAARPDLWQAWCVLVRQLTDMRQYEEARKLSLEAAQRFPLIPDVWVEFARVEEARLDITSEIEALAKAIELRPGYAYASRQLAGIYVRRNELGKARAELEQAVAANPLDTLNHGSLAHVLWLQGERDLAIARAQHALLLHPGYDWAWNALREWTTEIGRPGAAADLARDLTRSRGGEARSWLMLANALDPKQNGEEVFASLNRALELNPRSEEVYDVQARALALLDRFDEALAQCAPASLQPVPIRLRLRAAWIETQRGNLARAIEQAKDALAEYPDYFWGWQLLADWYAQSQQLEQASSAAQKMADLAPLEVVPVGLLGSLKLKLGDAKAASAAFQRAFALDPDYEFAGYELFRLQLADGDTVAAEQTLKVLGRRGENHKTLSAGVELAAVSRDWPRALELFQRVCEAKDVEVWSLALAAQRLDDQGLHRKVGKILQSRVSGGECQPGLAEFWVRRETNRGRWNLHKQLLHLQQGDTGRRAVLCYLDSLGRSLQVARQRKDVTTPLQLRYHFWRLMEQHRSWLNADVDGWGKVGFVLTCIGRPRAVVSWLGDWKERPRAESWMLYNLVLMLQRQGRYAESLNIIRHAVSLRHEEEFYETFRVWAAFEEALLGNMVEAAKHLANLHANSIAAHLKPLQVMTHLLCRHADEPGMKETEWSRLVRNELRIAFGKLPPSSSTDYVKSAYWRFFKASSRGLFGLWCWARWFYL